MVRFALFPLVVLFASPEASAPEKAFQETVAHVRKHEFFEAWQGLAPKLRDKLESELRRKVRADEDANMREVFAAWEDKMSRRDNDALKQLKNLEVKIDKTEKKSDEHVLLHVSTKSPGFPGRGIVEMRRTLGKWPNNGKWRIADVRPTGEPNPGPMSLKANQLATVATLRNLISAQAQVQAVGIVDVNNNGVGEYATFGEMSGRDKVRGGDRALMPPVLSTAFKNAKDGIVKRNGYHYRIYLPGKNGEAIAGKTGAKGIHADHAEVVWCVYAWPVEKGKTGKYLFFTNQMGDVLMTDARDESGSKGPSPYAAFAPGADGKPAKSINGETAIGKKSSDGRIWKPAG